ncbi:DUF2249 domain-containing protein [Kyrpidia sp.]|uniref:DUF2249 domain-containing protein n=1 Tax=Kyrpidia sp. TaxID=2073077 RepID=UPI0018292B27|nr:DUF2249 domain-containing protein [Kyrpidia sp.]MCL6576986.1 DUF2249 domain-containing protein [Kyrpidia sp.]HHY65818.1 DUF2249 domain-containing protein [Alicyclobacillus sp.]
MRRIVDLDVRDMLRAKQEPFERIMETVSCLEPEDVFQLHATFRPDPLIRVLGRQGYRSTVVQESEEHFIVQFYREETERPFFRLDNRGLEPPEPMMRTLNFLEQHPECRAGELGLEIWNERVPAFLLPELEERGYRYDIEQEESGTVRVKIYRAQ